MRKKKLEANDEAAELGVNDKNTADKASEARPKPKLDMLKITGTAAVVGRVGGRGGSGLGSTCVSTCVRTCVQTCV